MFNHVLIRISGVGNKVFGIFLIITVDSKARFFCHQDTFMKHSFALQVYKATQSLLDVEEEKQK